jgi:DNA polymerase-3 subunit alpha
VPVALQEDCLTTQYAKVVVEEPDLSKIDFLELKTLIVIDITERNIRRRDEFKDFNVFNISLENKETFDLMTSGETIRVFHEFTGIRQPCKQFRFFSVDEISAMNALYLPR